MGDVTTSTVGGNDFGGGSQDVPLGLVFPGYRGSYGQAWQSGDDLVGDEPTTNAAPGHVSNGIRVAHPRAADPFPGARPPGTQGAIAGSAPGWFVDQQPNATDYDVAPDPALGAP